MQSSQPGTGRRPAPSDALATDTAEALQRAQRQLRNLLRNAERGTPGGAPQRQLLREALKNLQHGMAPADRGAAPDELTSTAQRQLEQEDVAPLDFSVVRRLLAQLDRMQVERITEHEPEKKSNVTHVGPQTYPPGYRDWIQRYFRRLAEQP